MKTLRISDEAHTKLTAVVGKLTAETEMKTFSDAIEALLTGCVVLSSELLDSVKDFVEKNPDLGHYNQEEFVEDAIRFKLMETIEKWAFKKPKQTEGMRFLL